MKGITPEILSLHIRYKPNIKDSRAMYRNFASKTAMVFGLSLILTLLTPSLESSEDSTIPSTAAWPYTLTKVVIDAGHGGKDPGCLGKHSREKDIALKISLELGEMIEKNHPDVSGFLICL